jgi:L-threonylcarbamoyladenylate synthase
VAVASQPAALAAAAQAVRAGGVVLHPAEAVWGLACDPASASAVAAVYALKQRPSGKGLILVSDDFDRLAPLLAPVPTARLRAALATWPGPRTWVFPAAAGCPDWLAGERGSLAIRVSAHPPLRALVAAAGTALVSTSANTSGRPPPARLDQVEPAILAGVQAVAPGATGTLERPTPIHDVMTGELLRD